MPSVRFIQYGLGPIGLGIAGLALERGHQLAGAFDIDPQKVGRPIADLLPAAPHALRVERPEPAAFAGRADVVLHSTQSRLNQVRPQLEPLIDAGLHVISTCEELAYPWYHHRDEAAALDERARRRGVVVTGLGVNPGFVMDLLPVVLTAPCRNITRIIAERVVDAGLRRLPLQRKVGVGLTQEEFRRGVDEGRLAHVGLPHSVAMIADALGWSLDAIEETIEPVLGPNNSVRGLHQVCRGRVAGRETITLDLTMAADADRPRDAVVIEGTPPVRMEIAGGVHGDYATSAIAVNAIPQVLQAPPGLRIATELALRPPRPSA